MPPATRILGTSITNNAIFYYDGSGSTGNHTYENLSIVGGRTGLHYYDAANVHLINVGVSCVNDGHADNCSVLMTNTFWGWYDYCAFHGPTTTKPAVILRGIDEPSKADTSGLQRFQNVTFYNGGVETQINTSSPPSSADNIFMLNCLLGTRRDNRC